MISEQISPCKEGLQSRDYRTTRLLQDHTDDQSVWPTFLKRLRKAWTQSFGSQIIAINLLSSHKLEMDDLGTI